MMDEDGWRLDKAKQMIEHHEKRIAVLTKVVAELERIGHDAAAWKTEVNQLQAEVEDYYILVLNPKE